MNVRIFNILMLFTFLSHAAVSADEMTARNLLISQGCKGCHTFEGAGGILGPSLDQVGRRLSRSQLEQKLLRPQASNKDSVMPGYRHLEDAQLQALVNFLKAQK